MLPLSSRCFNRVLKSPAQQSPCTDLRFSILVAPDQQRRHRERDGDRVANGSLDDLDGASVRFHQLRDDRKTSAAAGDRPGGVAAVEAFEHVLTVVEGDGGYGRESAVFAYRSSEITQYWLPQSCESD